MRRSLQKLLIFRFSDVANRLDFQVDGNLVTHDGAGFDGFGPLQTEIFAIDLGGGLESDPLVAPRILDTPGVLRIQSHGLSDSMNGQIAGNFQSSTGAQAFIAAVPF